MHWYYLNPDWMTSSPESSLQVRNNCSYRQKCAHTSHTLIIRVFYNDIGFGMSPFLCYAAAGNNILFLIRIKILLELFFSYNVEEETAAFMKMALGILHFKPTLQCILEWGTWILSCHPRLLCTLCLSISFKECFPFI